MGNKIKIEAWNSLSPRRRKLALWIFWLLFAYTVIGFFILPPIIRAVAVKQLSKQLDREVSIQKVKLNPFAFSTAIRGLLIKDKDGQPFVSWDEVYVNFQLSSFLGHPWVFKQIRITGPFARVQLNQDGTFNFSDLIAKFAATNAPAPPPPKTPSKPVDLWIGQLLITNATVSVTDLTHRQPFHRLVGPLDFTLDHFETNPDNKNPHQFTGTTDAGETITWNGFFYLNPLRSWGELTLDNFPLNKYAPLYQDRVPFEIRDGFVGLDVNYRLVLSDTNRVMEVTNTSFTLRDFKLAPPGAAADMVELTRFAITGVSADAVARETEIDNVSADGGRFFLLRQPNDSTNVAAAAPAPAPAPPTETATNAPGGIPALLSSITNAVTLLLHSTNLWTGTVHDVEFTNLSFRLEDRANSRPATLDLDDIALSIKNISNDPKTNLTTGLSLRWNTNGTLRIETSIAFVPPAAEVKFDLNRIDFGTLDPYLGPKLNLRIPDSQFGLRGRIQLQTPAGQLPEISFQGDTWLDDFRAVDGTMGDDLLKWNSIRISGIDVNLNPLAVAIGEIALNDVAAALVVETNHTSNLQLALHPPGTSEPAAAGAPAVTNTTVTAAAAPAPAATNAAPPAALPAISIGSIVISNTSAGFIDRSFTPNVKMAIQQIGGEIAGISSTSTTNAVINLHASVDGVGPVDITGHINPFVQDGNKDLKVTVKNVDLTPASQYAGKFAGYGIAHGKLNLELVYGLTGRNLESTNVITLDRFTFGNKVNSPDATHLPVRLAIALLKDRNGQILLDVPVEGNLDDPKFRIGRVVVHTLLNILEKAATSPFSLLGSLVGGGGEELSYQDFAPGSAVLSLASQKKLDSLVKALYERPGLELEIAGSVDPEADRYGLRSAALDKEIHTRQWQSLRKSERAATTPNQIIITPEQHADWVKKLYSEAVGKGIISPEFIAAHTNLAAIAAEIKPPSSEAEKGATLLMKGLPAPSKTGRNAATRPAQTAAPTDPKEILLVASLPVTDDDLAALAADRAKAVRAYILSTGRVEAQRVTLAENQAGGVRPDGCRAYLQLQ